MDAPDGAITEPALVDAALLDCVVVDCSFTAGEATGASGIIFGSGILAIVMSGVAIPAVPVIDVASSVAPIPLPDKSIIGGIAAPAATVFKSGKSTGANGDFCATVF